MVFCGLFHSSNCLLSVLSPSSSSIFRTPMLAAFVALRLKAGTSLSMMLSSCAISVDFSRGNAPIPSVRIEFCKAFA